MQERIKAIIETSLKQWKEEDERIKNHPSVTLVITNKRKAIEIPSKAVRENHYGTLSNHT